MSFLLQDKAGVSPSWQAWPWLLSEFLQTRQHEPAFFNNPSWILRRTPTCMTVSEVSMFDSPLTQLGTQTFAQAFLYLTTSGNGTELRVDWSPLDCWCSVCAHHLSSVWPYRPNLSKIQSWTETAFSSTERWYRHQKCSTGCQTIAVPILALSQDRTVCHWTQVQ